MSRDPLLKGLRPVHPGESLREVVFPALGKPKAEIARLVGGGPEIWLAMQQDYDLEIAERALAKELKAIPTLQAAE